MRLEADIWTATAVPLPFELDAPKRISKWSTSFIDNNGLPMHGWFRYSAGFSALWVREVLLKARAEGRHHVLDPFAGSGTTILEASVAGLSAIGVEAHPIVARIANAKLSFAADPDTFIGQATKVADAAFTICSTGDHPSELIRKCYPPETLRRLNSLRAAYEAHADGSIYSELIWLALMCILREVSPVGTASWQYVLPKKKKVYSGDPYDAFRKRVQSMRFDIEEMQRTKYEQAETKILQSDARTLAGVPDNWADTVITSPPYANNYDYADALRLEMSFFGDVERWSDLHPKIRRHLICSCSQHASAESITIDEVLANPAVRQIRDALAPVCRELSALKQTRGGKKAYDVMIARYFADMAQFFISLRRVTVEGAMVALVVGDSAPYGVHVPVDTWLGELALSAGFARYQFTKVRDRNTKWKNRKHRVPLHEGELWIEG